MALRDLLAADLAFMLRDVPGSVTVQLGANPATTGVREQRDLGGQDDAGRVIPRVTTIDVATEDLAPGGPLAGLAEEATLLVDGAPTVVRFKEQIDDGALTRVYVSD